MKNITLLALLLFFCNQASNAQFNLTINGFVSKTDSAKNYIVYEFDSINQADLYRSVLQFVLSAYTSPKDVLSEMPNEAITIHGYQPDKIGIPRKSSIDRKLLGKYEATYNISYTISLKFKENKVRIDQPIFQCYRILNGGKKSTLSLTNEGGFLSDDDRIFNPKTGKVENEDVKNQIEIFFNSLCTKIEQSIINKDVEW